MSEIISKTLVNVARGMHVQFTLRSMQIPLSEVFSPVGLLPALAKRADQLCSLCLGYGIGATFEEAEGTELGIRVTFDDVTPNVLRYLCIIDVVNEIIKSASDQKMVAMDELLYD